jgi:hypothetical protein
MAYNEAFDIHGKEDVNAMEKMLSLSQNIITNLMRTL